MVWQPGHETERKPPFRFGVYTRVGFSDTDAQGVVYYGRYLPYFDLARTEYLRRVTPLHDRGCELVLRAQTIEYEAPARFDDLLEVFVRIPRIGRSSLTWELAAYRVEGEAERLVATATQIQVLIEKATRVPQAISNAFRDAVAAVEEPAA